MNTTPLSLVMLIALAQEREIVAHRMTADALFGKRCLTAFPELYRHPEIRRTRGVLPALRQWTFDLSGVQFLVQWTGGRGGYWKFWAWSDAECVAAGDTGDYDSPSPDTALACFIGEALDAAAVSVVMEVRAVA